MQISVPISKIIGFGKITQKFINDEIVWPDERMMGRSIWKYKLKLNIIYVLEWSAYLAMLSQQNEIGTYDDYV